jgi:hypothetical protein
VTPTVPAASADGPPQARRRRAAIVSRVLAAIVGGWVFAWGFVVLGIALGRRAGLSYEDAQTLSWLLVFLVYVATACWSFAAASALRVWAVLVGGGAAMTGAGWWLLRAGA